MFQVEGEDSNTGNGEDADKVGRVVFLNLLSFGAFVYFFLRLKIYMEFTSRPKK